jgi:pseudouridine-5'-phosphate glycosidase
MAALVMDPEVEAALRDGRPVVGLESTLITHGFAAPDGLEVARASEKAVRSRGAVPATCAVLGGVPRVGLSPADLERLASAGRAAVKIGVADIAEAVARGRDGSATVSATVLLCARANIRVMATGGIGGVHRGDSGDVSSDLTALAAEPVAVVSSGAKAVLDLPRTLEMLETLGVPVVGYRTGELPGFVTRETGLRLSLRADSTEEIAALLVARWHTLRQTGGVLIANPPPEDVALSRAEADAAVESALAAARARGVRGKEVTPFLLERMAEASSARSIPVNQRLIVENAAVAADIARAWSEAATPMPMPGPR